MDEHRWKDNLKGYVTYIIGYYQVSAVKRYTETFDPFYGWNLGKFNGEEIRNALLDLYSNSARLHGHLKTDKHLEHLLPLVDYCDELHGSKSPANYTLADWLAVRNHHMQQEKKQLAEIRDAIEFNDKIGTGTAATYKEEAFDTMSEMIYGVDEDERIKEELIDLLNYDYQNNWLVLDFYPASGQTPCRLRIIDLNANAGEMPACQKKINGYLKPRVVRFETEIKEKVHSGKTYPYFEIVFVPKEG
jgi:hypothetical protein